MAVTFVQASPVSPCWGFFFPNEVAALVPAFVCMLIAGYLRFPLFELDQIGRR